MIGLIDSWDVEYNGTENEALFKLVCDSAAELSSLTHYDNIKIRIGSECTDISTGDKYLKSSSVWVLQPSANVWENVYTKAQVDSMLNTQYQTMVYYHTVQTSTTGTITFYAFAGFVGSLTIYGNGSQTGTPSPDNIIMPTFCGKLDGTDWTIPITCGGQTIPVYLGEVPTVRRVKKLVLDGKENWLVNWRPATGTYSTLLTDSTNKIYDVLLCTHFEIESYEQMYHTDTVGVSTVRNSKYLIAIRVPDTIASNDTEFKAWLAAQYAAGTPVTVWYVLATPETTIVNEPLAKIGDYADILPLTDTLAPIPTVDGENTLTVDTTLPPSKIEISGER